jgi:hypothetical protein
VNHTKPRPATDFFNSLLERITAILDAPAMAPIREQFLDIG